jgi:hypothetical protein
MQAIKISYLALDGRARWLARFRAGLSRSAILPTSDPAGNIDNIGIRSSVTVEDHHPMHK